MAIITVAGLKGGVGKTTIATGLGTCFHVAGANTVVVDADPRRVATRWATVGMGAGNQIPRVEYVEARALSRRVEELATEAEVVVVDAPPWLGQEIKDSLLLAHLVLLPVMPGGYDIWVLQETLAVLADARQVRKDLRAFVVPNAVDNTKSSELMVTSLPKLGVPVLGKGLSRRAVHREVGLAGAGVTEYAPSSPAADEMRSLFRGVRAALERKGKGGRAQA